MTDHGLPSGAISQAIDRLRGEFTAQTGAMETRLHRQIQTVEESLEQALNETADRLARSIEKRVTMDRYRPVELLIYGLVAMVMTGFIGAVLALAFQKGPP